MGLDVKEANTCAPRLLTINGAALALGVSPWSVRAMIWDGEVPFVRVGRAHMIDRADLEQWVNSHKEQNGTGTIAGTRKPRAINNVVSMN
jgi:excisionase family DNA binding protein